MKAVLDACILYPTVLREILIGLAEAGAFEPIWSERLLEEWRRAALRNGGKADEALALAEISQLNAKFPKALRPEAEEAPFWLPDPADIHVLALAVEQRVDAIITLNLRDFPKRELSAFGVVAISPDAFLVDQWLADEPQVTSVVSRVHGVAERLAGAPIDLRALLKRARLPRLGRALTR